MLETIVGALLPVVITVLLGFVAAKHHDFGLKDAPILNRMVITYALPLSIFLAIVGRTRAGLVKDLPLLTVLAIAIVGFYGAAFLVCRVVFHFSLGMSALGALAASAPNGPFVGAAVLGYLYGKASGIPVALCGMLIYLTVAPATVILLSLDAAGRALKSEPLPAHPAAPSSSPVAPPRVDVVGKIVESLKQPVVWLPLLGSVIVIVGIPVPSLIANSLALLGQSASGVALFAAGVILAVHKVIVNGPVLFLVFVKNILQPALVWASLILLGYANPLLGEAVVTAALPMLVLIVMLAVQYQVAETETASALFISTIASLLTTGGFIALTSR
jgi:malonate transporter